MFRPDLNNPRLGMKFFDLNLKVNEDMKDEGVAVTQSAAPQVTIETALEKLDNGDVDGAMEDLRSLGCNPILYKDDETGEFTLKYTDNGRRKSVHGWMPTDKSEEPDEPEGAGDTTPPEQPEVNPEDPVVTTPPDEPETNPERPVVTTPPEDPVDKIPPEGDGGTEGASGASGTGGTDGAEGTDNGGSKEATEEEQIKALEGTLIELAAIYTDTTGKRYVVVKEKNITGNRETERIFIQTEEGLKEVKNAEIKDGKLVAKEGLEIEISDTITKAADIQADYDAKVKAQKEEAEQIEALEGTVLETLPSIYTDENGKQYEVVREKKITGDRETERIFIKTEEGLKEVINGEIKDGKLVAKEGLEIEISDTITKAADIQADYDAKVKAQKEEAEQIEALEGTVLETLPSIYTDENGKQYEVVREKKITGDRETERIFIKTEEGLKEVINGEIKDGKLVAKEGLKLQISSTVTKAADVQADYDVQVKSAQEEAEQIKALEGTLIETLAVTYTDETGKEYEVVREKNVTGDRSSERIFIKTEDGLKEVKNAEIKDGKLVAKEGLKLEISKTITKAADIQADYDAKVKAEEDKAKLASSSAAIIETIKEVLAERLDTITTGNKFIHTEFGVDKDGNIVFQESSTKTVFDNIFKQIKVELANLEKYGKINVKDVMDAIGGDAGLEKLIQAAWIMTYNDFNSSQSNNANSFVTKVLDNLQSIFKTIESNPETLEYYTMRGSYADSTVTDGVKHYGTDTTYGDDETILYSEPTEYDDGTIHIDNRRDDNDYQTTMNELLKKLIAKYPGLDESVITKLFREAQKNALNAAVNNSADCPYGTGNNSGRVEDDNKDWGGKDSRKGDKGKIHMDELVQLTLYNFDKLFLQEITKATSAEDTKTSTPEDSSSDSSLVFADAIDYTIDALEEVVDMKVDNIISGLKNPNPYNTGKSYFDMHTEFGVNKDGNIVFQESSTQEVFENILKELKNRISRIEQYGNMSNVIETLGGEAVLKKLVQAAWITTYNTYNSSTSHDPEKFVKDVLKNLNKILEKVKENPETLEYFTMRGSYADSTVTDGVKHYGTDTTYGDDETILYSEPTEYDDGTIHIDNRRDDNDYQTTMNELLKKLIAKYPGLDESVITKLFREAQKNALNAAVNNSADCPYGTGNNSGRVEDDNKDWGGKDSRKGDKGKIHMDELVQLTLYNFDKLLYEHLIGGEKAADNTKTTPTPPSTPTPPQTPPNKGRKNPDLPSWERDARETLFFTDDSLM